MKNRRPLIYAVLGLILYMAVSSDAPAPARLSAEGMAYLQTECLKNLEGLQGNMEARLKYCACATDQLQKGWVGETHQTYLRELGKSYTETYANARNLRRVVAQNVLIDEEGTRKIFLSEIGWVKDFAALKNTRDDYLKRAEEMWQRSQSECLRKD